MTKYADSHHQAPHGDSTALSASASPKGCAHNALGDTIEAYYDIDQRQGCGHRRKRAPGTIQHFQIKASRCIAKSDFSIHLLCYGYVKFPLPSECHYNGFTLGIRLFTRVFPSHWDTL